MKTKEIPSSKIKINSLLSIREKGLINLKSLAREAGLNYNTLIARLNNKSKLPVDDAIRLENTLTELRDHLTKQLR